LERLEEKRLQLTAVVGLSASRAGRERAAQSSRLSPNYALRATSLIAAPFDIEHTLYSEYCNTSASPQTNDEQA
jgi:hypothetical protein